MVSPKYLDGKYFRLMYVTVRPLWDRLVPIGYPLPAVGEEIEFSEGPRYVVSSRIWDVDSHGMPGVAIHLREK